MEIIPAKDVLDILKEAGITNTIFVNEEQETGPFPALTVRRYGGAANPRWARDQVLIQVRCKGLKFGGEEAEKLLYKVRDILLGVNTIDRGDYEYARFLIISDVTFIGSDTDNKPIFTLNLEATIDWKIQIGNREPIN